MKDSTERLDGLQEEIVNLTERNVRSGLLTGPLS